MSYTPPAGNAIDFEFSETPYVPPAGDAIVFEFSPVVSGATALIRRTLTALGTRIGSRQLHGGH